MDNFNPYEGVSSRPITRRDRYIGQERAFHELERNVRNCTNTVIYGLEGSGKSSLLSCFFTREYCLQMAREEQILIKRISFEPGGGYLSFADGVRDAAELLKTLGMQDEYDDIYTSAQEYRTQNSPSDYLSNVCGKIGSYGYTAILVIDQFEGFASSSHIDVEEHDMMRSLLHSKRLTLIVATDYDFDQASLPENAAGSYLNNCFADLECQIVLRPLSGDECALYLHGISGRDDFTREQIKWLRMLSGGNPVLLRRAAYCAYELLLDGQLENRWNDVLDYVQQTGEFLMQRWLKFLNVKEEAVFAELVGHGENIVALGTDLVEGGAALLERRGLIVGVLDEKTGRRLPNCYDFNSITLERYCIKNRPAAHSVPSARSNQPQAAQTKTEVNIYGDFYAGPTTVYHGIPATQILSLLSASGGSRELFAERLHEIWLRNLPAVDRTALPPAAEGDPWAEHELDVKSSQISQQYIQDVQLDEENDLVDVSTEQLITLETRFADARSRCKSELTDELMALLSERSQFYLKMGVVVEDALAFTEAFYEADFSPQIVMYGKALEQALRDAFFKLFHKEPKLSVYDVYTHMENADSRNAFLNMDIMDTYIGNYAFLIKGREKYLSDLCVANQVFAETDGSADALVKWWDGLYQHVQTARGVRNMIHAGKVTPQKSHFDTICQALLGDGSTVGVLQAANIGRQLYYRLFSEKIPASVALALTGKSCEMRCIKRKTNGGIQGILTDGEYTVNVSPKKVQMFCSLNDIEQGGFHPVDKLFTVRILEAREQDDKAFFAGELLKEVVPAAPGVG